MELTIQLESEISQGDLFGPGDKHLRIVRDDCDVRISARGHRITIMGKRQNVQDAAGIIDRMQKHLIRFGQLAGADVVALSAQKDQQLQIDKSNAIAVYSPKGIIEPFTKGQIKYVDTMQKHDITFCTGPAGTGKTYLAVAIAVSMLKKKQAAHR